IPVEDPYNLYFTPDGTKAIVVAERLSRLDFRDPRTWHLDESVGVPCRGVDHADFSADGTTMVASCEFSGQLIRVDVNNPTVGGSPDMGGVSVDGSRLWLSGRYDSDVLVIDTASGKVVHHIPVGAGPHGLCVWPQPGRFSLGHTGNMR